MRTIVFNQGFNRVESHNIIRLERVKLNRLLDDERRRAEALADEVKRRISAAPAAPCDVKVLWNVIQNHSFLKLLSERINLLTDAYPQFTDQVERARRHLKKRIIDALEITPQNAQRLSPCD